MKVLQLNGTQSYTSPVIKNVQVRKGETVRCTEAAAAHMLGLYRLNEEMAQVKFFELAKDQTIWTHDAMSAADLEADALLCPKLNEPVEELEDFSKAPDDDQVAGEAEVKETTTIRRPQPRQRVVATK